MWRPGGGVGGEEKVAYSPVKGKLQTTMAGVITRFTCVVERDSSGVIT